MSDYDSWWHDGNLALDVTLVEKFASGGHVLEVMDHDRFGRVVAVDGRLAYVEEDAAWRESLVHVAVSGLPAAEPLRVLVVGGDPSIAAEALRRPEVALVALEFADGAFQAKWAAAVGLGHDPRLRVATPADRFDIAFIPRLTAGLPWATLAPRGIAVVGDAIVLEKQGARWLHEPPTQTAAARWFAMSPLAPGGFYGFSAFAQHPVDLAQPRRPFTGRHYNQDLHRAAFVLPGFMKELP